MTTEAVLLLGLFVFLLMGTFLGSNGPRNVFGQHAPMLAARVEAQLTTGKDWVGQGQGTLRWQPPTRQPTGTFNQ